MAYNSVKMDGIDQNTCRAHPHKMHTSNATKITKHQVLISNSSKHHIALLHQRFGPQDGLKRAWHNGTK